MPTALVTGAPGLVGSHVGRLLVQRGDDVRLGVRETSRLDNLLALDAQRVVVDIMDRASVRRAMKGVDRVFHVAGSTNLRSSREELMAANVEGTRIVLSEALKAGVSRVVHTSSIAAVGPAPRGSSADESQAWTASKHGIAYIDAKREAEELALSFNEKGLEVVVVNPGHVLGRGDVNRSSTDIVRRFLLRRIPAYVDGAVNVVDAEDVARGHLLADERGTPGERYILGNRNFTLERLLADLGRLSGVEPPALKLPLPVALGYARAAAALPGTAPVTETELRMASMWWSFRTTKARRELGYAPAHHEDTLQATIDWYREREGDRMAPPGSRQAFGLRVVGGAVRLVGGVAGRLVP